MKSRRWLRKLMSFNSLCPLNLSLFPFQDVELKHRLIIIFIFFILMNDIGFSDDSSGNRNDKTFFIGITAASIHIPTLLTHPYTMGIYWGENFSIGLETGSESPLFHHQFEIEGFTIEPHSDSSPEDKEGTVSHAILSYNGAYVRYFAGNSFNLLFAVSQRDWKGVVTIKKNGANQPEILTAETEIDASAKIATVGIGNQWLFDNGLAIGVDWLVVSVSISRSFSSTVKSNTGINETEVQKELTDLGKVLNAISTSPGVVVLTIGWSF